MLRNSLMKKEYKSLCKQLQTKSLESLDALAAIAKWIQENSKVLLQSSTDISEVNFEHLIHKIEYSMVELLRQFPSEYQADIKEVLSTIRSEFTRNIQTLVKSPKLNESKDELRDDAPSLYASIQNNTSPPEEEIAHPLSTTKKLEEKLNDLKRNYLSLHSQMYKPNSAEDKRKIPKLEKLIEEGEERKKTLPVKDPSYKTLEEDICCYEDTLFRLLDADEIQEMEREIEAETHLQQYQSRQPITPNNTDIAEISIDARRTYGMFRTETSITLALPLPESQNKGTKTFTSSP